jgi:hypothetical protein
MASNTHGGNRLALYLSACSREVVCVISGNQELTTVNSLRLQQKLPCPQPILVRFLMCPLPLAVRQQYYDGLVDNVQEEIITEHNEDLVYCVGAYLSNKLNAFLDKSWIRDVAPFCLSKRIAEMSPERIGQRSRF